MRPVQDIIPLSYGSGLNYDDDLAIIPKGDSKYRLNISIDEQEYGGAVIRPLGNKILKRYVNAGSAVFPATMVDSGTTKDYTFSTTVTYMNSTGYGYIVNIITDYGNHKLFHTNINGYSSDDDACDALKNRILALGDPYISYAAYTRIGSNVTFTIYILTTTSETGVATASFSYNTSLDNYMSAKDVVGTYYHEKDNALYFFLTYDDNGNGLYSDNIVAMYDYNSGLCHILNSNSVTFPSGMVLWNKHNPIKATVIGDDEDKLLIWTDGITGNYQLNINRAINTAYGFYGEIYSQHTDNDLKKKIFSFIKPQPDYPASVTSGPSGSGNVTINTDVVKRPFQCMYRYVFIDNQISVWSTASDINMHGGERADGLISSDINTYEFQCTIEALYSRDVFRVQFAYRSATQDNWRLFQTQDLTYPTTIITITFNGSDPIEVLDDKGANILFDNVPINSGSIAVINDNRILLADNTVGYPNVDVDVDLDVVSSAAGIYENNCRWRNAVTISSTEKDIYTTSAQLGSLGSVYMVFATTFTKHIIQYDSYDAPSSTAITSYFVDYINTKIVGYDSNITSAAVASGVVRITHKAGTWSYGYGVVYPAYSKTMGIKSGISQPLGIVYYDIFGRMGYVNDIGSVYVPFYSEQSTYTNNEYADVIKLTINHIPPIWAYSWGIFYGDNNPYYRQTVLRVSDFQRESGNLRIKLNDILNDITLLNPSFNATYQFTPGDRLRWIGTVGNYTESGIYQRKRVTLLTEYIDSEVLGYAGDYNEYLVVKDYSAYDTSKTAINAATYVLVEIYSAKIDRPSFYYETPYKFPVKNPGTSGRIHGVFYEPVTGYGYKQSSNYGITVQNQTASLPAVCYFDKMDYRIFQHFAFDSTGPIACHIDSQSFSNYMDSRLRNYGRPHIINPDARQVRLNNLMWGGVYIPYTRINSLNTFIFGDEKPLNDKYGRITGMELTGDVLNVIQEAKISTVYLQSEIGVDASGNQTMAFTSNIIGSIRPGAEPYGSADKYSIVRAGNYVYGFDLQSGVPWRKAYNGTEDISRYKMRAYFRAKSKTLLASGRENVLLRAGYDNYKQIYYLTFIDERNPENSETIAFHEPTNRWISFYSFIPDMYASIENMQFIVFNGGDMYIQDDATANRATYFGTAYKSEVWVIGNIYPDNPKTFEVMLESSNAVWDMPDNDSIVVDEDAIDYTNSDYTVSKGKMYSRLKSGRFVNRSGVFRAAFLGDISRADKEKSLSLFSERKLRGKVITCKLENDDNAAVYLKSVVIGSSI